MSKRESSGPSNGCHCMEKYSSFDNLPKEIMVEIMFRLPPESLMRLKSLNKSWYFVIRCLIKDPDFMAKHLRHAEEHPVMFLVNERRSLETPSETKTGLSKSKLRTQRSWSTLITRLIDKGNIHCVTENIDVPHLPSSLTAESRDCVEVYHCNGIICYTNGSMRIFTLYSPVTGKFETFHPKPIGRDPRVYVMGFGSDSGGSNFKIVRILRSMMRAQIFTPGTSDSWREINMSIQDRSYRHMYDHVYLNGHCFWIAWDHFNTVLRFDVCSEAFREIRLPNELDAGRGAVGLASVNDSVCLLSYPYKKPIDVWVMDINSFSWRKWLRIEHFEEFLYPLAFWSSNELLMKAENGEMVSYNIQSQKLRSVSPKVMLGDIFYLGFYIKSLASAKWVL